MIGRALADGVWVTGQIRLEDLAALGAQGVRVVVNNRPDGESPGQPSSSEVEAAARAAGLRYVHAPVAGMPGRAAISEVEAVLANGQPVLLYCKSGMRSAAAWALAVSQTGVMTRADIVAAARDAGYDLSGLPL